MTGNLYHCTDPGGLDYLAGPTDWVHPNAGDTIKPGWTMTRLCVLWLSMIGGSVLLSLMVARWVLKGSRTAGRGFEVEAIGAVAKRG